jgi:putative hydroxymethylpyrimidine transport system substrate-binding protein
MRSRGLTVALVALAFVPAAIVLAACGEKPENQTATTPESLTLTLDWFPNPDHVAIYEAQQRGYFQDAGLDVRIQTPSDPAAPIKQVAAGRTDLAISYEPEVLLAHEQGLDVKAVGALFDHPLTSLIWLRKSGIKRLADLRGKTIATAGIPYQDAYLKTILARAKLATSDVKEVNVGQGLLPAILSGRAQAMLGGFANVEGVELKLRGKAPTVTPVDRLGVPTYDELVFVARASSLADHSQPIRLFLAALARGAAAAEQHPRQATQALLKANPGLDEKVTAAEVSATLPLLSQGTAQHPFGYMDQAQWKVFIGWMRDHGLIASLPVAAALLTDELLPGNIPG